jgi:hypothetical protein
MPEPLTPTETVISPAWELSAEPVEKATAPVGLKDEEVFPVLNLIEPEVPAFPPFTVVKEIEPELDADEAPDVKAIDPPVATDADPPSKVRPPASPSIETPPFKVTDPPRPTSPPFEA